MLTARAAATLLANADAPAALAPLLVALGFHAPPARLDAAARAALGIPTACDTALVARGDGALRALIVDLPPAPGGESARNGSALREAVARLAGRLAVRTPQLCWLAIAVERGGPHTVIAAWSGADRSDVAKPRAAPRVAALVVDRRRVVDSDADTLRTLAALSREPATGDPPAPDLLTHARWLDVLGRDALGRAFYRALEGTVAHLAASLEPAAPRERRAARLSDDDRRAIALLYVSRLVFLSFLEAKGWLDGDRAFLAHLFERTTERGHGVHRRALLPLFFGTLNTPLRRRAATARAFGRVPFLNGGLFARSAVERRADGVFFTDESLGRVFGDLLERYRFTAREDSTAWSEAAIDPEMLGRAFESLMVATDRRASGTFYTPHAIVREVVEHAIRQALLAPAVAPDAVDALLRDDRHATVDAPTRAALRTRAASLRLLDPACGSGAFLVHALERLSGILVTLGDHRPLPDVRRAVLARSIFGVDVNPTAVWLCELRLWLSVVIESDETDPRVVPPLPNLDRNVRVGDSLAGDAFVGGEAARDAHAVGRRLAALRERYARASGPRKRTLAAALDREERRHAIAAVDGRRAAVHRERREIICALRAPDLFGERRRADVALRDRLNELRRTARVLTARRRHLADGGALPFSWSASFADAALAGGFDAVVGNPPWVRLHHIPASGRVELRRDYAVFRNAAWARGAEGASAGRGFAAQVDLSALFVERSVALLRPAGTLAFLVPAKLWRSLAGGGVRALLTASADVVALEDWSDARVAFDAATYPSLVVARRRQRSVDVGDAELPLLSAHEIGDAPATAGLHSDADPPLAAAVRRGDVTERWTMDRRALSLDASPGSPWLLLPPSVRCAFDRVAAVGVPLARSAIGRPHLGVKSGCNDAFLVRELDAGAASDVARVADAAGREGTVERELLRPLVRGERVARWRRPLDDARILWTADDAGRALPRLPPHAAAWLSPWRRQLAGRADARGATSRGRWWSLFRVDAADPTRPRVVWADVARAPRAAVLRRGDRAVPLNSCYVVHCDGDDDAFAFAALLNAPLSAAWLDAIAEPARGSYHRYLGWTVALLPLPRDWPRARALLAPLGRRAFVGDQGVDDELHAATLAAYHLVAGDVAALLAWHARSGGQFPHVPSADGGVDDPRPLALAGTGR